MYDPEFSGWSYGFREGRKAQQAVEQSHPILPYPISVFSDGLSYTFLKETSYFELTLLIQNKFIQSKFKREFTIYNNYTLNSLTKLRSTIGLTHSDIQCSTNHPDHLAALRQYFYTCSSISD